MRSSIRVWRSFLIHQHVNVFKMIHGLSQASDFIDIQYKETSCLLSFVTSFYWNPKPHFTAELSWNKINMEILHKHKNFLYEARYRDSSFHRRLAFLYLHKKWTLDFSKQRQIFLTSSKKFFLSFSPQLEWDLKHDISSERLITITF